MSLLDPFTVAVMTMVVVCVSGTVFLVETLLRRDERASRLWALGFVAMMLSSVASLVFAGHSDAGWVIGAANAAIVAATGCMWLGCRRYNARSIMAPLVLVTAISLAVGVASILAGSPRGPVALVATSLGLAVTAALGAIEAMTGEMAGVRTAWGLSFVFAVQALFSVARVIVFLTAGPRSELFRLWFGVAFTSFVTVGLVIVAVVVVSVLRARRAPLRGYGPSLDVPTADGSDVLPAATFRRRLSGVVQRAEARGELVAVIGVHLEDLEQISTAFGSEVSRSVAEAWRGGVRAAVSPLALIGEDELTGLLVAVLATSPTDARRQATHVYRALFDDLSGVAGGVTPVIGVGVALSAAEGYAPDELIRVARGAAHRAVVSVESSVLVGEEQRVSEL